MAPTSLQASVEGKTPSQKYDPASLEGLLPVYYKHLFPIGPYYKWLNYKNKKG